MGKETAIDKADIEGVAIVGDYDIGLIEEGAQASAQLSVVSLVFPIEQVVRKGQCGDFLLVVPLVGRTENERVALGPNG